MGYHRFCMQTSVCLYRMSSEMIRYTDNHSIWIPLWLHLSLYIQFMRTGRNNIDIVPTIITEEFWIALALVSASTPVLMRVAKKFTAPGVTLNTARGYGSKSGSNKQKTTGFRPDDVTNTSHVDTHMLKRMHEGASIGSNADSHTGILRQVDFQVSSETKDTTY